MYFRSMRTWVPLIHYTPSRFFGVPQLGSPIQSLNGSYIRTPIRPKMCIGRHGFEPLQICRSSRLMLRAPGKPPGMSQKLCRGLGGCTALRPWPFKNPSANFVCRFAVSRGLTHHLTLSTGIPCVSCAVDCAMPRSPLPDTQVAAFPNGLPLLV